MGSFSCLVNHNKYNVIDWFHNITKFYIDPKNSNKLIKCLPWLLLFFIVWGMAYLRPIHQDDGWYASYAFRILQNFQDYSDLSYWSFKDANYSDISVGFLFSSLQVPFYLTFGINVFAARLFNAIIITLLLFFVYKVTRNIAPGLQGLMVILLLANQVFYHHFYNRPEILGIALALMSIFLLTSTLQSNLKTFFAFFIWGLIIDVHSIAIFTVIGLGIWYFFNNRKKTIWIILGGISGIILMLLGNLIINNNFGLLNGIFGGEPPGLGDHYIPLFKSDIKDYMRIFTSRFEWIKFIVLFSWIWIIVPLLIWKRLVSNALFIAILINFCSFWILATFLTEATSNGFALYNIIMFLLLLIVCLKQLNGIIKLKYKNKLLFLMIPLILYTGLATTRKLYVNCSKSFNSRNEFKNVEWDNCIPNGSKILMRPTFAFALAYRNLHVDYPLGVMNLMKDNNFNFEEVLKLKKYDYIALDEQFTSGMLFIDKHNNGRSLAYKKYNNIGISREGFNDLVKSGFLEITCKINEPMHGLTNVYKVNF